MFSLATVLADEIVPLYPQVAAFTRSEYEFTVEEEQSPGELVGQVVAVDRDLPPFNSVVYTPSSVPDNDPAFRIVATNGTIVTCRTIDRELTDHFRFVVQACSPANACSTAHVTINVTDINDHAPEFLLPATPNYSVSVTNYFRRGDAIARLIATDADVGNNGRVRYQLVDVDRAIDFYFRLDDVSGDILARRNDMATGTYMLVVAATDAGTPPRHVQSALTIVVNISTSGYEGQSLSDVAGANNLAVVIVIVGVSFPVAILLFAAILVLLRSRNRGDRTAVTSRDVDDSKSPPDGIATSQEFATLNRGRTTTRLATAALTQPRSTLTSSLTRINITHDNSTRVCML